MKKWINLRKVFEKSKFNIPIRKPTLLERIFSTEPTEFDNLVNFMSNLPYGTKIRNKNGRIGYFVKSFISDDGSGYFIENVIQIKYPEGLETTASFSSFDILI